MKREDVTKTILLTLSLFILLTSFIFSRENIGLLIIGILALLSSFILNKRAGEIVNLSKGNPKVKTFKFLNLLSLGVLLLTLIISLLSSKNEIAITEENKVLVILLVGIFMMVFGNLSPKIPFNRYLGLRLPWTIRDEETWKIAHRLLGYISFPIALGMIIMSFFLKGSLVLTLGVLSLVIIPSIYSYIFYYKKIKSLR